MTTRHRPHVSAEDIAALTNITVRKPVSCDTLARLEHLDLIEVRVDLTALGEELLASARGDAESPIERFARLALDSARRAKTGRWGDNKVFVSHAWAQFKRDGHAGRGASSLREFKDRLVETNRAALISLSRADLVEAMSPKDVRESEISHLGATFHFIRLR